MDGAATSRAADLAIRAHAGTTRLMLPRLAPGIHVVTLRATAASGVRATIRTRVRILRPRVAAPAFTG